MTIPISALIGFSLLGYWSFLTPVYAFVAIPLLEIVLPQDHSNTTEEVKEKKLVNKLFDWMLYLNLPIVYAILLFAMLTISTTSLSIAEWIGLVMSLGIVLGTNGINVGHELGHRTTLWERILGKALLLPSLYMHFFIEHNYGHHVYAATREDPATARYGESVYAFWFRSVTHQYFSAWGLQKKLLDNDSLPWYHVKNDMLYFTMLQVLYLFGIWYFFGLAGLLFAVASAITGFLLLETVNYIEHYGLLRLKKPSGRYERVKEIHSWNSNHVMGRIVLYELTRHSDHHYISSKKYQVLDCHETSPQMPFGYPTSMVLSLIPPLWFYIMNPRIPPAMKPGSDKQLEGIPI